ncbi:hypothetical protein BDV28DRAFT_147249 [Aspergillus coremiiformis]|uniref:SNF2 family helicase/ATPase n=1 Tax=Aspergillus coremiiformis TaxID=138285 RepID=A0A5N6ZBS6_9EURO|nr:hypothetical protein BDV28DRAFT_147249 [Aspergillus coremiiformis]
MPADETDPIDWSVDEVVEFLCHNPHTPWSQSVSGAPRPDPLSFEVALRDNLITGEVLLNDVDKNALRDDLGLKALGHRSSMLTAIRYLQGHSLKHQLSKSHLGSPGDRSAVLSPSLSTFNTPKVINQDWPLAYRGPIRLTTTPQRANIPPCVSVVANTEAATFPDVPNSGGFAGPSSTPKDAPEVANLETNIEDLGPGERVRPQEQVFVDVHGRKRRRLNLTTMTESRPNTELASNKVQPKEWYMGPGQITPSELFYSADPDQNDQSFAMVGSNFPTAQRLFVNRCLHYFQKQKLISLNSDKDQIQSAILPYDTSKVKSGEKWFTLYTAKNGKVYVSTESVEDWPQLHQSQPASDGAPTKTIDPSDPFSYLLQKYPVRDENQDAFPLYGDSGSEGEFDEETWQEIDDERQEGLPPKRLKLTPTEVESVIRDCVSQYENKWHEKGLLKEQHKARKLWLRAKMGKSTNQEIKELTRKITLLDKRLRKLQEAVRESEYATKPELETQCQSMEQTVMDIQQLRWRVAVLEQEKCPPKVSPPPKSPPTQRPKHYSADEESLHSEAGDMSADSMDEFIDRSDIEDQNHQVEINSRTRTPPVSDDSEDDIISPSGIRRKSRANRLPFRQSSSPRSPVRWNGATLEVIDLTGDSPAPDNEEYRIETPPLNPVQRARTQPSSDTIKSERSPSISPGPCLGSKVMVQIPVDKEKQSILFKSRKRQSLPDIHDDRLLSVPWDLLEARQDRRRLLAKLIATLSNEERKKLTKLTPRYSRFDLKELTEMALKLLLKNQKMIPELDAAESSLIMRIATFFISWVNCVYLPSEGIQKNLVLQAQSEIDGFFKYRNELCARLVDHRKKGSKKYPANAKEQTPDLSDTPHKKRKREVKESQNAKKNQESAQLRVALQEKQRKILEQEIGSMNTDPTRQAVSFGNPAIYLDPHIGLRVKPHQLNGIQFMWRELIEDENKQGCLLAHTMGLGKTMQVISLLATISAAAASDDIKVSQQVPAAFHRSQTLILCPSSLIENWFEEFLMWAPERSGIGTLRKITSSSTMVERLQEMCDWDDEGGVLIMSYDLFRTCVLNRETKQRGKPLSDSDYEKVRQCLLDGPNIIVADEAHKLKNPTTGIAKAAMQFRSKSRIALTGSPLANNLIDYYAMVNWIAEGYLGEFVEFKAKFVEPITEGLYVDSTYTERRKSLVKLQVLKEILAPKINRADISVLAGSLPTKVEFVITVSLTSLQKQAYDSYVGTILQGKGAFANAQIWSWLAILSLCCNHPSCFRDKLLSRASDAQKANKKLEGMETIPGDEPITQAGLPDSEKLVSEQEQIFATVSDMMALELSHRARIMNLIINESIKAGDKVLVFSHSIQTLNYIEHILRSTNRQYSRLDGRTPVVTRQDATKRFNRGSDQQVYLISTRAGGLGLNIPGANRVIIFDFKFSPVWEEQAVGRAYRLGQQKPVYVYRFIAGGTFEEVMYNKAVFKTQLAFRVVDKKNPVRWASKSLGEYLFPTKPVPQKDVSEYLGRDPQVLDKIIMNDNGEETSIRNIALTETFQKEDNDKLTEEERKGVQEQLDDERLKRTDPEAYFKLMVERQRQAFAAHPSQVPDWNTPAYMHRISMPPQPYSSLPNPPTVPSNAHNTGPPALAPDMSISQEPLPFRQPILTAPAAAMLPTTEIHEDRSHYARSEPPTAINATHTNFMDSPAMSLGQAATQPPMQMDGAFSYPYVEQYKAAADPANAELLQSSDENSDSSYNYH